MRLSHRAGSLPVATLTYAALLAATSLILTVSSAHTDAELVAALSTNLHQLGRVPLRVLVGSAFWIGGFRDLAVWALLLAAVAVPVERRLGWRRTCGAFALGHVGATLLVAAGLWIGVSAGALPRSLDTATDVGASYGFLAVAGLATSLLPRVPARVASAGVLAALLAASVLTPSFTAVGHVLAFALGLAFAIWSVRGPRVGRYPARPFSAAHDPRASAIAVSPARR